MRKRTIAGLAVITVSLFLVQIPGASAAGYALQIASGADASTAPISNNTLTGTAGISRNDTWAVGYYADPDAADHPLAEHWDGTRWALVPTPDGAGGSMLNAVTAVSPNDVWAVGLQNADDAVTFDTTLIEHWTGGAWTVVPSPNASANGDVLTGVSAVSANDVWAVGYAETDDAAAVAPLLEHWDGTAWRIAAAPNTPSSTDFLRAVSAVSANDVWAVGSTIDPVGFATEDLILHWDGTRWTVLPTLAVNDSLWGVHAVSANDVWAVGQRAGTGGVPNSLAAHWDGTRWSPVPVPVPNAGTGANVLNAVTGMPGQDVWAVGSVDDPTGFDQTLVERWTGTAWQVVPSPNRNPQGGNPNTLLAVTGSTQGTVTAVGTWDSFEPGNPGARTLILSTPRG